MIKLSAGFMGLFNADDQNVQLIPSQNCFPIIQAFPFESEVRNDCNFLLLLSKKVSVCRLC